MGGAMNPEQIVNIEQILKISDEKIKNMTDNMTAEQLRNIISIMNDPRQLIWLNPEQRIRHGIIYNYLEKVLNEKYPPVNFSQYGNMEI